MYNALLGTVIPLEAILFQTCFLELSYTFTCILGRCVYKIRDYGILLSFWILTSAKLRTVYGISFHKFSDHRGLTGNVVDAKSIANGFKPRPGYTRRVFHFSLRLRLVFEDPRYSFYKTND